MHGNASCIEGRPPISFVKRHKGGGTEHGAHFVITQYTIKIQTKIGEGEARKNPKLRHIGTEKQRAPSLDMTPQFNNRYDISSYCAVVGW